MRRKYQRQTPAKKYQIVDRFCYTKKDPRFDFLKYLRLTRKYIDIKYDITFPELETLLFLYNQKLFTKTDFEEYREIYSWNNMMFTNLYERNLIAVWREKRGNLCQLYELSTSGKRIITTFYKILTGEMNISESAKRNPIFKKKSYSDKVYANAIKKMNADEDRKKLTQLK